MSHILRSKVALVTAGSAGLGAAIARHLACNAHMRVVVNYFSNSERADTLIQELRQLNSPATPTGVNGRDERFVAIKANMQDRASIVRLVEDTYATMGRIDVVISNAGWTQVRDFNNLDDNMEEDDWDRCFTANVKSHLWLFYACHRHLDQTEGAFVSTASVAGVKPSGSSLPYATSKAALIHLTKCLATIAAPRVRVNSISPGIMLTDWGLSFDHDRLEAARESNKLKRFATVEDVAKAVSNLALSRSVTGQNVVVDAGFSV